MADDGQETPTLEEILGDTPSEKLDQPCHDEHLGEIARHVTNWLTLVPFLGVSGAEEKEILGNWPRDTAKQKIDFFRKWQEKRGRKATYRRLCKGIWKAGEVRLVERVCSILSRQESSSESSSDDEATQVTPPAAKRPRLSSSLLPTDCSPGSSSSALYRTDPPPPMTSEVDPLAMERYTEHLPGVFDPQCPSQSTGKAFNLTMIRAQEIIRRTLPDERMVRQLLEGNVGNVINGKTVIQVVDLFDPEFHSSAGRKIALVEGPPGGGKTVLAQDVYQKWKSKEMFRNLFKVVILIQLQDPNVQSATSLSELLQTLSAVRSEVVVTQILQDKGSAVLFIVDGWDRLKPDLREKSFFSTLVCNPRELKLKHSTLLITSSPIASAQIQQHASARFEIEGWTPDRIHQYFKDTLGDLLAVQNVRPDVEASCYLPQTAESVAHVLMRRNPADHTSLLQVFEPVVCGCLRQYLKRTSGMDEEISSLTKLPSSVEGEFQDICKLAYEGSMEKKVTFSVQDLESYELSPELNGLDLMQVVPSRSSKLWYFLSLLVQELLTALYVSKLPVPQQGNIFNKFMKHRSAAILCFYAAITKLKNEVFRNFVTTFFCKRSPIENLVFVISYPVSPTLLAILHCLYEAQESSLCHFVATKLNGELSLCNTPMKPLDCLAVGYFVGFVSMNTTSGRFEADLSSCSIDQHGFKFFARGLSHYTNCNSASEGLELSRHASSFPGVELNIAHNNIDLAGLVNLTSERKLSSGLVAIQCSNIGVTTVNNGLLLEKMLSENKTLKELEFHGAIFQATGLSYLAKGLAHNTGLTKVSLQMCICEVNDENTPLLAEMLAKNSTLKELNLSENPLGVAGLRCIAEGMRQNTGLETLLLRNCGLIANDENGPLLEQMLRENKTLKELDLSQNSSLVSGVGLEHIVRGMKENTGIVKLSLLQDCSMLQSATITTLLADMLLENRTLEKLDLSGLHCLTSSDLLVLGQSLKRNRCLNTLGLLNVFKLFTQPTDPDLQDFISSLKENDHLINLHVDHGIVYDVAEQAVKLVGEERCMRDPGLPPLKCHSDELRLFAYQ